MYGSEADALIQLKAPLGQSYRCWAAKKYNFLPLDGSVSTYKDNATLVMSNFQLQPFLDDQTVFGEGELITCNQPIILCVISKSDCNCRTCMPRRFDSQASTPSSGRYRDDRGW